MIVISMVVISMVVISMAFISAFDVYLVVISMVVISMAFISAFDVYLVVISMVVVSMVAISPTWCLLLFTPRVGFWHCLPGLPFMNTLANHHQHHYRHPHHILPSALRDLNCDMSRFTEGTQSIFSFSCTL